MEIDNQTNDPIDYEQTGSGGGQDPEEGNCVEQGTVDKGGQANFAPCGEPPYNLQINDKKTGAAMVQITELSPTSKVVLL